MIQVLVVEDDPMVMDLNCRFVETVEGFAVAAKAGDGVAAVKAMEEHDIDLIVLDIFMPLLNGVDFLAKLRSDGNLVDVIFLTASADTLTINKAIKLGFFDYLIKPFTYERFAASLESYRIFRQTLYASASATQEQLDRVIKSLSSPESAQVAKGMHQKTLENVRACINESRGDTITQQEVARRLGLSRVTVRRYMAHLVSTREVEMRVEYGSVGRPSYSYRKL